MGIDERPIPLRYTPSQSLLDLLDAQSSMGPQPDSWFLSLTDESSQFCGHDPQPIVGHEVETLLTVAEGPVVPGGRGIRCRGARVP